MKLLIERRGAKASAITYSVIETAKENGLNPFPYLECLFRQLPNVDWANQLELLEEYLPWANLPEECYSKKGKENT